MKLKNEFVTVTDKNGTITVSTDTSLFSGIIRSNATANFILECLKSDTSLDQIVNKMTTEYAVDETTARRDVEAVIAQLNSINALDE